MDLFFKYSRVFQFLTGIIPLLFLLAYKRKLRLELVVFLLASVITTLILFITGLYSIKNWFFFNLFSVINLTCMSVFYFSILHSKISKVIVLIITTICAMAIILELTYYDVINLSFPILKLGITLFTFIYFLDKLANKNQSNTPAYNIINTALCIYNCFSIFMSLEMEIMLKNNFWLIHNVLEGTSKILIAYAILKLPKMDKVIKRESLGVNP